MNYDYVSYYFQEFYPYELELKEENAHGDVPTFLDLNITTNEGQFPTSLYDKRDGFIFSTVKLTHKYGNIPSKTCFTQPFPLKF